MRARGKKSGNVAAPVQGSNPPAPIALTSKRQPPVSALPSGWPMYVACVLTAAVLFTAGGVSMKASVGMTRLAPTLLFFLLFATGAAFQALALREADLGVAYLVVLGLEAVLAAALGVVVYAEPVSAAKCLGVLAVVLGVVLLHLGDARPPAGPAARSATAPTE